MDNISLKENMLDMLDGVMSEEEIDKSVSLFEKFVKCRVEDDNFGENEVDIMLENSQVIAKCDLTKIQRVKSFFEKMLKLKKEEFSEQKLEEFYKKIDFYTFYNDEVLQVKGAKKYEIIIYFWNIYLKECLENEKVINNAYYNGSDSLNIDLFEYAKNQKERIEKDELDVTSRYVQLTEENPIDSGRRVTKFLGGAGAGKTTAMRRCYYLELENVVKNGANVLPIWIDLKDIGHQELLEKISQCLEMDRVVVQDFLKANDKEKTVKIILYLDGYNEILATTEETRLEKRRISDEIEYFHRDYEDSTFVMTDRKGSIQIPVFTKSSYDVYEIECKEMDSEHIESYLNKKAMPPADGCKSAWEIFKSTTWTIKTSWTPAKLEKLMDYLLIKNELPENEEDFDFEYITSILQRERNIKKEVSLDLINRLLNSLAQGFAHAEDIIEKDELLDKWEKHPEKADNLLERVLQIPLLKQQRMGNEKYISFIDMSYYLYFKDKHYNRIDEEE